MTPNVSQLYTNLFPATLPNVLPKWLDVPVFAGAVVPLYSSPSEIQVAQILSENEIAVWQKYSLAKRRDEYLAGRLAAKIALSELPGNCSSPLLDFSAIQIENFDDGRPYCRFVTPPPELPEISISHSAAYAAALASYHPCGIDIQQQQDKLQKLKFRFTNTAEVAELKSHRPHDTELALLNLLWTAKEAIRKLFSHLYIPGFLEMLLVQCQRLENDASLLQFTVRHKPEEPVTVWICATFPTPGYALSITLAKGDHYA